MLRWLELVVVLKGEDGGAGGREEAAGPLVVRSTEIRGKKLAQQQEAQALQQLQQPQPLLINRAEKRKKKIEQQQEALQQQALQPLQPLDTRNATAVSLPSSSSSSSRPPRLPDDTRRQQGDPRLPDDARLQQEEPRLPDDARLNTSRFLPSRGRVVGDKNTAKFLQELPF